MTKKYTEADLIKIYFKYYEQTNGDMSRSIELAANALKIPQVEIDPRSPNTRPDPTNLLFQRLMTIANDIYQVN